MSSNYELNDWLSLKAKEFASFKKFKRIPAKPINLSDTAQAAKEKAEKGP